jgi:hypothetical protein
MNSAYTEVNQQGKRSKSELNPKHGSFSVAFKKKAKKA